MLRGFVPRGKRHLSIVKLYVETHHYKLEYKEKENLTPLANAAWNGRVEIVDICYDMELIYIPKAMAVAIRNRDVTLPEHLGLLRVTIPFLYYALHLCNPQKYVQLHEYSFYKSNRMLFTPDLVILFRIIAFLSLLEQGK